MLSSFLLIAAILAAAEGNPISARAELDASEIPFHHVAHYRVTVECPSETETVVEPWGATLPGLEIAVVPPVERPLDDGRKSVLVEFLLTPSIINRYNLPETRVLAGGKVAAVLEGQEFVVRDLNPEEKAAVSEAAALMSLADIRASGVPSWLRFSGPVVGSLAALALALVIFVLFRRRFILKRAGSPREVAEAALASLDARLRADEIACDAFFLQLAHIFRTYLCAGFDPAIAGQSTPEFLAETLPALPIPPSQEANIRVLLQGFDRVLFAQHVTEREGQAKALVAVHEMIMSLERETATRAAQALQGAA